MYIFLRFLIRSDSSRRSAVDCRVLVSCTSCTTLHVNECAVTDSSAHSHRYEQSSEYCICSRLMLSITRPAVS